jgi:8-oxo-dGTP diphosphatase
LEPFSFRGNTALSLKCGKMERKIFDLATRSPNYMQGLFNLDPLVTGVKGIVFVEGQVVLCRRDFNTTDHPGHLDLLGGGVDEGETPFSTFQREAREEAGVVIEPSDIVYARRYDGPVPGKFSYFPVARAHGSTADLRLGNEGLELVSMPLKEYMTRPDAIDFFRRRTELFRDLAQLAFMSLETGRVDCIELL